MVGISHSTFYWLVFGHKLCSRSARSVAENDGETLSRRPQTTELSTVPSVTHSSQIMSTLIPMKGLLGYQQSTGQHSYIMLGSIPKPMWKKQSLILYSCK